jgi:hypothetical protein
VTKTRYKSSSLEILQSIHLPPKVLGIPFAKATYRRFEAIASNQTKMRVLRFERMDFTSSPQGLTTAEAAGDVACHNSLKDNAERHE